MTYPGGKGGAGVAQTIINQQPPHEIYIEAFLGSGAVMRAKRPASTNIGIDVDRSAIAAFDGGPTDLELIDGDAIDFLLKRRWTGRELVYCDPPYVMATRRSHRALYTHEFSDEQHIELLTILQGLPCMVQLSGYYSSLYNQRLLKGWRLVKFQAMTRRGPAQEFLWMNYPEPRALHDYSFLGANFRERERIKRKAMRWVNRINRLPALESLALRSALATDGDARGSAGIDGFADAGQLPGVIAVSNEPCRPQPAEMTVL